MRVLFDLIRLVAIAAGAKVASEHWSQGGAQTDTSASNEDISGAQISASSATIYVVVYEFKVVGQYDTLAGAKSKLSEYSGHGKNRMVVPVNHGLAQYRPVDFNKNNRLNWWWGGWGEIDRMVAAAGEWMVEENKPGDYLVVHEKAVKGRYDKLADARSELLKYTGYGNNRMVVPVSNGAAQSKPDDFNKKKYLNWWWGGNVQLAYMVDTAKTYLVELNTRGDYLVINEKNVVGRYNNLAEARSKLLQYTGHGNNRMVVPVISGEVQSRPDNFNKDKDLNWWWAGQAALDSMVDIAKAYVKPGDYLVVYKEERATKYVIMGRYDNLAGAKSKLLEFGDHWGNSRMVVPVFGGVVGSKSQADDFNKVNALNWWWGGHSDLNAMIDFAKDYMVEANKPGDPLLDNKGGEDGIPNMPKCTGECDTSSDCAAGLRCKQRDGVEQVPGCRGEGISGWDYCYDPEALDSSHGGDGSPNMPKCAGDCDRDSDCEDGLKCFQRNGFTTVPGCSGSGTKDWDYCYDPNGLDSSRGADGSRSMPKCAGDCDKDSDCAGNLKCWERDGFTSVPGCNGIGVKDWDYCYDPVDALPPPLDSSPGVHGSPNMPRCAGDCDKDSDCAGGLKCFQRDRLEAVPGCSGSGKSAWDYCYDPTMHHGSGIQIGSTIVIFNAKFKHFIRNQAGRTISSIKGLPKDVTMDWTQQRFTVLDAGDYLIALHSQKYNCFLRITSANAVSCSAHMASTSTPPSESKFQAIPAQDGLFGLYSHTRARYLRFKNANKLFDGLTGTPDKVPADTSSSSVMFELLQVPQHLQIGSLVGLWRSKNLLSMQSESKMRSRGPLAEGRLLPAWSSEQFEVVDAGYGQVALYCSTLRRFVKMTAAGAVQPGTEKDITAGVTSEERFAVVPSAANKIALHNSAAKRFLIISSPTQAPTNLRANVEAADAQPSYIWMKIVPIRDDQTTSTMPGCCNCDHTMDRCRSGSVWMKSEPSLRMKDGGAPQSWQVTADPKGSSEVRWDCSGTGERTGFNMPATHVRSTYRSSDGGKLDFHPEYCAPLTYAPRESPKDRGCCSIADGTVDRCRSRQYIKIEVGSEWKFCYKGQTCEWEFPQPHSQGTTLHWYCGETKESVAWGLYFDTLQIKFHCNGEIEWNPWWCGLATGGEMPPAASTRLLDVFRVNSNGDLVDGKTGSRLSSSQIISKAHGFARDNKDVICEGLSASAVYDQLLRPSGTCWRAGMTGRSSLFAGHSDYGTKTSLFEEGTRFTREERPHSSNLLALADHVAKNASLLQMGLSANLSNKEMLEFLPGLMTAYCAATGGTDCAGIGMEKCECYCVQPGRCTQVLAEKYAKSIAAIIEMASDIALAVMSGGGYAAAKAGAKAASKAAMKAAAKKGMQGAGKRAIAKAAVTAGKAAAKKAAKASLKTQGKKTMKKTALKALKSGVKDTVKSMVTDALLDALGLGNVCEDILETVLGQEVKDPDWVNDPEYKWGSEDGPAGYMETVDITGITALVGIFHEADCPTPVPGSLEGCPR